MKEGTENYVTSIKKVGILKNERDQQRKGFKHGKKEGPAKQGR
jgi:hypothetical protein